MIVRMDRYSRYFVNKKRGVEIGHVYRANFRMQWGNGIGSLFRGLFRFVKPLFYSGAKAFGKKALKSASNKITDNLNKEPEQPEGAIFKNRFSEAKGNFEEKIKKMTVYGLDLKRKRKSERAQANVGR